MTIEKNTRILLMQCNGRFPFIGMICISKLNKVKGFIQHSRVQVLREERFYGWSWSCDRQSTSCDTSWTWLPGLSRYLSAETVCNIWKGFALYQSGFLKDRKNQIKSILITEKSFKKIKNFQCVKQYWLTILIANL